MRNPLKFSLPLLLLTVLVVLTACESKWEKMPDDDLVNKSSECLNISDPGAAMIQVCKNIKRECERRRKIGVYLC
jgi:hypothetical protein|tara:strand:- start:468 stop:692 length:225 start_codon:yes stop_codon:yes gene_type:complete